MLDVIKRPKELQVNERDKTLIMLHGVTGTSEECYMQDLAGECYDNNINVIMFNHYAPRGEENVRLMDLGHNKYLDEVIEYACKTFGHKTDIYLAGFSLGGNHVLRYAGQAAKNHH